MVWVVGEFVDQSVSTVTEKWLRKNDRKCWYPKTNVLVKIKTEADVNKKSGEWTLYSFRILMKGERFSTYAEAREAEKIAQSHSTMTAYQNSFLAKQEGRKHPKVYDSDSSSPPENETKDTKNLKKLRKLDAGLASNEDKDYNYSRNDNDTHSSDLGQSANINTEKGDYRSVKSGSTNNDDWLIESGSNREDFNEDVNDVNDDNENSDAEIFSEVDNNLSSIDVVKRQSTMNESNGLTNFGNNLESTEQLPSAGSGYDFNEDRRLVRLEKLLTYACQELKSIKTDVTEIRKKSSETESGIQNLGLICKDLSVEVFACTEEIKKRNGMFTDILVPDIKLPIKKIKRYGTVELALIRHKIVDNLIKYLASTVNETKEKPFIRKCLSVIFGLKFFCLKVWWKSMPRKVNIKNSQILHCMRESFKIKFGLVEPKKTDKEIESLIYKIGRNIKDSWRKTQKKNDIAGQDEDDWNALLRNGYRRKRGTEQDIRVKREGNTEVNEKSEENKKDAKKPKGAKRVSETKEDMPSKKRKVERGDDALKDEAKKAALDDDAWKDEEAIRAAKEDKKAKKADKKTKKAKNAADAALDDDVRKDEDATRAAEEDKKAKKAAKKAKKAADAALDDDARKDAEATRAAEEGKKAKKAAKKAVDATRGYDTRKTEFEQREYIPKRKAECDDQFESKGKVKKCKKE